MTCVCLNGYSELHSQYFYTRIVRFESQEYSFGYAVIGYAEIEFYHLDFGAWARVASGSFDV